VSLAGSIWALFNVGYIILISFAPPLLVSRGISIKDAGVATSIASWTIIPTIALGGLLLDRMGHATALMITSFTVLGLSIMLLPTASSLALIAFIGAIAGVPCGAMLVLPAEVLRPQSRGPGMGIFFTWYPGMGIFFTWYPGMGIFFTWYYVGMALLTQRRALSAISQAILERP
jgi:hypothetical protein